MGSQLGIENIKNKIVTYFVLQIKKENVVYGEWLKLLSYFSKKYLINERNYKIMTKAELIKSIGNKVEGVNQKQIDEVLSALSETIVEVVKADDKVTIPNIGTVSVKDVPERRGTIMIGERKGEEYVVEAHREPKMKLTKGFKDCLL